MEILEKIGDAASKTYKYTAEKTSKIAKETKIKMQINEYKREIKDIYLEIGETVYEKFNVDEKLDLNEINKKCEAIQSLSNKIIECKDEILKLNERKQCKNCYEEIEIEANYCPNCGFSQEKDIEIEEEKQNEENHVEVDKETEKSKKDKKEKEEQEDENKEE